MGVYVYPPVVLSSSPPTPTQVLNPDGTEAQFNFAPIQDGTVTSTAALSGVPTVVATLVADLKKIVAKNDSGNNLYIRCGARPRQVIPKGADYEEIDLFGALGEDVEVTTVSGAAGTAGEVQLSYLG